MSSLKPLRAREAPKRLYRTLDLTEARLEFGLHQEQIYGAVARGEVHAVARPPRDRRSLKGQIEYPEWELRKLAADLGLTIVHLESSELSRCYQPRVRLMEAIAA